MQTTEGLLNGTEMMKLQKIKAFTLFEVMIVISLTTLTILAIYGMVTNTNRLFAINTDNINQSYLFLQIHDVLYEDIMNCEKAEKLPGKLICISDRREILYRFENEYIIRQTDTFYFAPSYVKFQTIENTDLVSTVDIGFKNSRFYFVKKYPNSVLYHLTNKP